MTRLKISKTDWWFFAGVALLLVAGSLWSRVSGNLTMEGSVELVKNRLQRDLALDAPEVVVYSILLQSDSARREVSARLLGRVFTLKFQRRGREWEWTAVVFESGKEASVDEYVQLLRTESEEGALNALRLINTAQVGARLRNGRYGELDELQSDGLLMVDLKSGVPRGYIVELEIENNGSTYRAFATPRAYPHSGVRSFFTDENLIVHGSDAGGRRGSASDPAISEE